MNPFKSALILGISAVFVIAFFVLVIHLVLIGIAVGLVLFCCGWVINKIRGNKKPQPDYIDGKWRQV